MKSVLVPLAVLLAAIASPGAHAAPKWAIYDLGTLTYPESEARAINASAMVTGYAHDVSENGTAFVMADRQMTDIGSIGGKDAVGQAINALGQVAGTRIDFDGATSAFFYDGTTMTTIELAPSLALGVNDSGIVVGGFTTIQGWHKAYQWRLGNTDFIADLGGHNSEAHAINAVGTIVGWSQTAAAPDGPQHAFYASAGQAVDIGTLGGPTSQAQAVNLAGQVTGCADSSDGTSHAFVWKAGTLTDLGVLPGGSNTCGLSINARGRIVGRGADATGSWQAIGSTGGPVQLLSDLLSPKDRQHWRLLDADGINDDDEIVGSGLLDGQFVHAFLMRRH